MNEETTRNQLKGVFIKDMGWKTLDHDGIVEISEHQINSWVKIVYKEERHNWLVNPNWIIAKIRA